MKTEHELKVCFRDTRCNPVLGIWSCSEEWVKLQKNKEENL
jgi:hypothetical protein